MPERKPLKNVNTHSERSLSEQSKPEPKKKLTPEVILNASYNAIVAVDTNSRVVYLNERAESWLKLNRNEIIGQPVSKALPLSGPVVDQCVQTRKPQLGHHIHGKTVKAVLNAVPVIKDGKIIGAVCSLQDMGQFEESAKNLESYKKQNILLEAIFNASSDGLWVVDNDGTILNVNQAAESIIEVKAENVIGENIFDIEGKQIFDISPLPEVFETRRRVSHLSSVPGSKKTVLSTGTPVFDENGELILVVGNERDMTELNNTREELGQTLKMAEKIKDELAELTMLELRKEDFIAESKEIREVLTVALKLAHVNASNILITGESGTGKGLLAKFIHKHSPRAKNSFIAINCASLPDTLLEAELFGYEKGAFTGAREQGKAGLIELAQDGTLFLDEIGEMPLPLQAKLLKYLDDNEVRPLGATKTKKIECSVIAATNRDLEELSKKRMFREDMFYRLEAFAIQIPPLRKRPEDIFELANYFLKKYNKTYDQKKRISRRGIETMQLYSFQGNVRELKNLLKRAVVLSDTKTIDDFIIDSIQDRGGVVCRPDNQSNHKLDLKEQVFDAEKDVLAKGLKQFKSIRALAKHLGVSHSTVLRKMKKYGLNSQNR